MTQEPDGYSEPPATPSGARTKILRTWLLKTAELIRAWAGWRWIGYVLSAVIIVISAIVLWRILRDLQIEGVVGALRGTPPHKIIAAAVFVAAAFVTLTFYEFFGLRTIGIAHVPYRIAVMGSLTGYSIGHNVGAPAITGGAVRYRIYSPWGLRVIDIAKLCFITGLTFWLGNTTVLSLGMIIKPQAVTAVDHLPALANQIVGIVGLGFLIIYVVWAWRRQRTIGRNSWTVNLPSGPLTFLQIGIGILDLACTAYAMYLLMPEQPAIDFMTLAVIFASATLLGFASHAPGSMGVFDAAMLVALRQFDKEQLVAALLLFRLLYFVIPFTCALATLGLREIYVSVVEGRKVKGEVSRLLTFAPDMDKAKCKVKKVSRGLEEPTDA
jgi:glycosyltransferase 2 family protein